MVTWLRVPPAAAAAISSTGRALPPGHQLEALTSLLGIRAESVVSKST